MAADRARSPRRYCGYRTWWGWNWTRLAAPVWLCARAIRSASSAISDGWCANSGMRCAAWRRWTIRPRRWWATCWVGEGTEIRMTHERPSPTRAWFYLLWLSLRRQARARQMVGIALGL